MSSRGPRLLIPSGLLGVGVATLAILAINARRFPGEIRSVIVGSIALVIADGWIAFRALRRLDAEILTPSEVMLATPFEARARILGVRRPATVDPLFPGARSTHLDGPGPFTLPCHASQRGIFNHLLIEVRSRSPLGLWACARRIAVVLADPLCVTPAPRPCPIPAVARGATRSDDGGRWADRDQTVRSTRPYVPGDSSRLVHWPATAHEGRLMVRESGTDQEPLPALAVDLHRPGGDAEEALGRALTIAGAALARDGRVRLITAEARDDVAVAPIPRSILLPTATLRTGPPDPGPTRTVDRVEHTTAQVGRRLAAAETGPVDRDQLPPGTWIFSDLGDRW